MCTACTEIFVAVKDLVTVRANFMSICKCKQSKYCAVVLLAGIVHALISLDSDQNEDCVMDLLKVARHESVLTTFRVNFCCFPN